VQYGVWEISLLHEKMQVVFMLSLLAFGVSVWYRRHYQAPVAGLPMTSTSPDKDHSGRLVRLLKTFGPGLMVCLADSDIGGLATMAEAGSKTGYALMSLQFLLVPVLYVVQEMVVRLSVHRRKGVLALVRLELGYHAACVLLVVMVILGVFAVMSEFSGIAAVGDLFGLSSLQSCSGASVLLISVVLFGDYEVVERVGLILGSFLVVFLFTAVLCCPPWMEVMWSTFVPQRHGIHGASANDLRELTLANIGTVVTPWMLFYQASAIVEKQLSASSLPMARLDTLLGSVITQIVMCAVLITFAKQAGGVDLQAMKMGEAFSVPLQPLLGKACTQALLAAGLLGSSLLATLVISLGVAWNLAEYLDLELSGQKSPRIAAASKATGTPMFRFFFIGTVVLSAAVISSEMIGVMKLNILVQLLNGTLMPVVVGYVFVLVTRRGVLPDEHRVRGSYAAFVGIMVLLCSMLALGMGIQTALTGG